MKETVNVNIGSVAFTLDEDAYRVLGSYFDDIRRRLPEGDTETMSDIEARVAEIFRERVASPMRVITLDIVRATMAQMGNPSYFGEPRDAEQSGPARKQDETECAGQPPLRKLYRTRSERSIAGICGGLAAYFDSDPTLIRLMMILLTLFGGLSIWVYIILWVVIPEEPAPKFNINKKNR
ncbi:PspC domain-containing protein [Alistipes sp.]|uniref:PspC domain-containing protein n=1 Tax=Alistipes sp. TaxID=1872444 RepID=UPI0025C70081|nr:PspC domain-containing protein [Alistipes sp.]